MKLTSRQYDYKRMATMRNVRLYDYYDEAFPTQGIAESLHEAMEDNFQTDVDIIEYLGR